MRDLVLSSSDHCLSNNFTNQAKNSWQESDIETWDDFSYQQLNSISDSFPFFLYTFCCWRLQDVVGGDDARFSLLASLSELKLVGRLGPTKEQLQILHAFIDKQGADLKRRLKDQPEHRQGIIHEKHRGFDTERDKSRRPRSGRGYASHQFQGQRQPHVYHNTNLPRNGPYDYWHLVRLWLFTVFRRSNIALK